MPLPLAEEFFALVLGEKSGAQKPGCRFSQGVYDSSTGMRRERGMRVVQVLTCSCSSWASSHASMIQ